MAEEISKLMERFVGLGVDEGKALYATLSPEEQKALDDRGLKGSWRSMQASEARGRRQREARDHANAGKAPKLNAKMQKMLDDAKALRDDDATP